MDTNSDGGIPAEKSSGLEMSISTLPVRFSSPAASSAAIDPSPLVALTTSSASAAASANPARPTPGCCSCHTLNGGLPKESGSTRASVAWGSRVPTTTW